MSGDPVRVGFIGCGRVAENHYRALSRCRQARLVAVSSRSVERARTRAAGWGVEIADSPEQMLADGDIDVVFVLTPTEAHFSYAEMAIRKGKHVLVEKPVSYQPEEIAELSKLARRFDVRCLPGHSYLYLPEIRRLARLAAERAAGAPMYLYMSEIYRMPEEYLSRYHGPLREVLCHQIYILLALLGIPRRVQGFASRFGRSSGDTEEQVAVNLELPGGALAQLFLSWAGEDQTSDPWTFKIKLLGLDGGFHFSRRDAVTGISDKGPPWEYPLYQEMFEHEVDFFINECILHGREPLSTLHDAYLALKIMLAVEESIRRYTVVEITEGGTA